MVIVTIFMNVKNKLLQKMQQFIVKGEGHNE